MERGSPNISGPLFIGTRVRLPTINDSYPLLINTLRSLLTLYCPPVLCLNEEYRGV